MKFKDLVKLTTSELEDVADEEGFNYSSNTKRDKFITGLMSDEQNVNEKKNLLSYGADGVKQEAEKYDIEYTTKKETQSNIAQAIDSKAEKTEEEKGTWNEEFEEALWLAKKRAVNEKRSYKILEKGDEVNTFNVRPTYMKHDEEDELLLSIHVTEYLKNKL